MDISLCGGNGSSFCEKSKSKGKCFLNMFLSVGSSLQNKDKKAKKVDKKNFKSEILTPII